MSKAPVPSILIVDDEPGLRLALATHFLRQSWKVQTAGGVHEARSFVESCAFDLVICDVRMADGDGFSVLQSLAAFAPNTPLLFLTAYGSVPDAVHAMQAGAVDYLTKPVSFDHLFSVATRILGDRRDRSPKPELLPEAGSMIGSSRALLIALGRAKAAAESDADVLIEAESGTGKELLARMIHESSARRAGPFVAVNCAALPEALLESELFGHARGAFTGALAAKIGKFQVADAGTLLLDEIGEMPLNLQPKLLRVLQDRLVEKLGESRPVRTDIRVIASTNLHLGNRVERGLFRSDLYYRLNVIPLSLPPLRKRKDDLPLLAQHFVQNFAAKSLQRPVRLHSSFLDRLQGYDWPGNVRELGNFMQRVISMSNVEELTALHFDREHRPVHTLGAPTPSGTPNAWAPVRMLPMDELERTHLERTLELVGGNRTRAAEMLGISIRTMRNKIRQYDLPPRRYA